MNKKYNYPITTIMHNAPATMLATSPGLEQGDNIVNQQPSVDVPANNFVKAERNGIWNNEW